MKQDILAFEEFVKKNSEGFSRYSNFIGNWMNPKSIAGAIYRNTPHSLRFQKEFPELDSILLDYTSKIKKLSDREIVDYEKKLYEAYKIMKRWRISDKKLFT